MKLIIALFLFFPALSHAACLDPPRPGMTVNEVLVAAVPDTATGNISLLSAWTTTNPDRVCCTKMAFGGGYWRGMLDRQALLGAVPAPIFMATLPVRDDPRTAAETAMCQTMADAIIVVPRVVRNVQRTDGARPLKVLRYPAQLLSATNPLIDLKVAGVVQYAPAGNTCERTPVINTTSAGQWLYTTANGQRGVALCK